MSSIKDIKGNKTMAQKRKTTEISVHRDVLVEFMDDFLETSQIKDASCNGLQVQGTHLIKKIGLSVDASMETYRKAFEHNCQMLIVHHGIIWDGIKSVTGAQHAHLKYLLENDMNLYASHLPLDLHPEVGNNIQLAKILSIENVRPFGLYKGTVIGYEGAFKKSISRDTLVHFLCEQLDTECTVLPFGKQSIKTIAIVSGGGSHELPEAIDKGIDCFLTGEPDHTNYHKALEAGINVIYAGHYHTEKTGVQALGALVEKEFRIQTEFLDIPTAI
jgi:dinuclear metal center YbgI/SA1388 family protein